MPVAIGSRLGPYEILSAIGAGGMGEVYRARDPKLGRDVAIKVLPEAFARDADRMARFQREAKLLAALDHTNIASIYGLEDSGSTRALVMQLAEGPTLAERIKLGPVPIDESLPIAKQICDALEYAHEHGIIHRDLKPANVKVAADDTVKILDFGLAKALEEDAASLDISTSPTLSRLATIQGVLLGTAAYMSPEQAKGKAVDRRADIWAFGCVLYEMLTGKQAFSGETITDTLAAVVTREPDWSRIPAKTPARVSVLLQRCLQKDAKQRLRDIGDARISLDEVLSGAAEAASSLPAAGIPLRRLLPWAAAILVAAIALTAILIWNLRPSPPGAPRPVTRTVIMLPPGQRLEGLDQRALALSPDGSQLAYVATTIQPGGTQQIYLRAMDSLDAKPIPGTDGAADPFFSPDGQWLGFFADGKLKKISLGGGAVQNLADASFPLGASWGSTGTIVFAPQIGPLLQISDAGGSPRPLTQIEKGEIGHLWPEFLPGGKAVLFSLERGAVAVKPIEGGEPRNLVKTGDVPRYISPGYLTFVEAGNLMVQPFDPERLEVTGTAVPVVQGVSQGPAPAMGTQYSVSSSGSLVYVSGSVEGLQSRLVWVSRDGAEKPLPALAREYDNPRLSPDGRRVAVESDSQIWVYDLARDTLTRLTFSGRTNTHSIWTPDGKRIAFTSNEQGRYNMFWQMADGSGGPEQLTVSENLRFPVSWSPDGQLLAFAEIAPTTGGDIWVLHLGDRKAQPFLDTPAFEGAPEFSPDGRWLAYVSDESGRREVYVQAYPGPGGKWQVSTEGGNEPVWNRNGRELFFRTGDEMMVVEVTTQPSFSAGKPKKLFEGPYVTTNQTIPFYDVSPDGQRFLMLKPTEQEQVAQTRINVVLNWTEELKRLVPTGK